MKILKKNLFGLSVPVILAFSASFFLKGICDADGVTMPTPATMPSNPTPMPPPPAPPKITIDPLFGPDPAGPRDVGPFPWITIQVPAPGDQIVIQPVRNPLQPPLATSFPIQTPNGPITSVKCQTELKKPNVVVTCQFFLANGTVNDQFTMYIPYNNPGNPIVPTFQDVCDGQPSCYYDLMYPN